MTTDCDPFDYVASIKLTQGLKIMHPLLRTPCSLVCVVVFILIAFPAHSLGSAVPFTLTEAQQARDSARSVMRTRFVSAQHRYLYWIEGGSLIIAHEPDFAPETRVARSETGSVSGAYPSEDGQSIFYVLERGGSSAFKELRVLDMGDDAGLGTRVATGDDVPSSELFVAPGGQALAFTKGNALLEIRRSQHGRWERRTLLDPSEARHQSVVGFDDIVYSPDGTKVAFVTERKAKQQYVAVHDAGTGRTDYFHPSPFQDGALAWSPDGTELAFIRRPVNPVKDYRFSPERGKAGGVPWSIQAVNLQTGALRTVWQAERGPGSFPGGRLLWASSGDILFVWEKTGWDLLYAVPARGGTARLLTPGAGEIRGYGLSADGHTVVYSANFGDPLRDHLWSVSLKGGDPVQLTSGKGEEWIAGGWVGFNAGGYLSYVSENADQRPPQAMVRGPDGKSRALSRQPDAVVERNRAIWRHFLPVGTISVRAEDGVVSHHVVIKPSTPPPAGGYPVIVNAHGGPAEKTRASGGYAYTFGQYAAHHGYLFVDINYRGSTGFGLDYRLPEGRGATGGSEVKDLAALVGYLKSRDDVNPKRIGIAGASYGGHLVGLAMSRLPGDFAAGVSQFGVADWVVEMKKDMEAASGGPRDPLFYQRLSERERIEELAYASSPNSQIEHWRGPTLLTIGDLDTNGHMEAVQDLGYQLLKQGVPMEFYVDPAGEHNVFAWEKVFEFFERTLAAKD